MSRRPRESVQNYWSAKYHRREVRPTDKPWGDMCVTGNQWAGGQHRMPYRDDIYHSDFEGHSLDAPQMIPSGYCTNEWGVPQQHTLYRP